MSFECLAGQTHGAFLIRSASVSTFTRHAVSEWIAVRVLRITSCPLRASLLLPSSFLFLWKNHLPSLLPARRLKSSNLFVNASRLSYR